MKLLLFWILFLTPVFVQAQPERRLALYRDDLDRLRDAFGGSVDLPDIRFFQFGMGNRPKMIYRDGALKNALTDEVVASWTIERDIILPAEYTVHLSTTDGSVVQIVEDEEAVWIEENGVRKIIEDAGHPLRLPTFEGHPFASILRVLHHEILINIVESAPVPNYFVYRKPWYRDAAMMAMVLKETDNLDLIRAWILNLREPYDRNNTGETETDNLGQALYLISLVADRNHPLVEKVLEELPTFEVQDANGRYLRGRSDFAEHPVYQTRWAKLGLRALGLDDPYTVPNIQDSYASLFWIDEADAYVPGNDAMNRNDYPYLTWATDHFHGLRRGPISNRDYPLTWERNASQADYPALARLDSAYVAAKISTPHTWHAAEVFLYLLTVKPRGAATCCGGTGFSTDQ